MDSILKWKILNIESHRGLYLPLCLIYKKDLHNAIKFSQSFHFADDTGILSIQNKISKINDSLNKDLNELIFCLNTKKTALNVTN